MSYDNVEDLVNICECYG